MIKWKLKKKEAFFFSIITWTEISYKTYTLKRSILTDSWAKRETSCECFPCLSSWPKYIQHVRFPWDRTRQLCKRSTLKQTFQSLSLGKWLVLSFTFPILSSLVGFCFVLRSLPKILCFTYFFLSCTGFILHHFWGYCLSAAVISTCGSFMLLRVLKLFVSLQPILNPCR